jgi:hypothetical protein
MALQSLDAPQIIRDTYDPSNNAVKVNIVSGGSNSGLSVISTNNIPYTAIPDNASSPYQIVASLASDVRKIQIYDTTGSTMQIRTGAGSGSLLVYTGPGQDVPIELNISAGTRVTIRSDEASAPVAGNFIITFLG